MQFAPHFPKSELTRTTTGLFNQPDGSNLENLVRLSYVLEMLRYFLNRPIIVNSAFRSPSVNSKVGGAPKSYHLKGCAADIRVPGLSSKQLSEFIRVLYSSKSKLPPYAELLTYPGFVHIAFNPKTLTHAFGKKNP